MKNPNSHFPAQNQSFPIKQSNAWPGVIVLVIVCLLMFGMLTLMLYQNQMIPVPDFLKNIFQKPQNESTSQEKQFVSDFIHALSSMESEESGDIFSIDKEMLEQYIFAGEIENYHQKYLLTHTIQGKKQIQEVSLLRAGDKYKLDISINKSQNRQIICDGTQLFIQDSYTSQQASRILPLSPENEFSLYSEAGIPRIQDLLDLLDRAEKEGMISQIQYSIQLIRNHTFNAARITFFYPETQIREIYEVDLETAVLLKVESYWQNTLYYSMNTSFFSANLLTDPALFEIPLEKNSS